MPDIEARERHGAPPLRPGEIDLGVERHQRGREVAAVSGKAHAAALRRDVADVAGGLEAMMIGRAPPFALVVVDAAGVEAEIAADRAHVAVRRPGDLRRRLRHHRMMLNDVRMLGEFGERHRGADFERLCVGLDRAQFGHAIDVDQHRRRNDAAADVDDEIGAAAEHAAAGMRGTRRDHVVKRRRPHHLELRQRIHHALPCDGGRLARRIPACPLPPCGGGLGRGVVASPELAATPLPTALRAVDLPRKGGGKPRRCRAFIITRAQRCDHCPSPRHADASRSRRRRGRASPAGR